MYFLQAQWWDRGETRNYDEYAENLTAPTPEGK
jgi:hypothetical protein